MEKISDVTDATLMVLSERLQDALQSRERVEIDNLSKELVALTRNLIQNSSPEIQWAIVDCANNTVAFEAFRLGQIAFAQLLASQASIHRADDGFSNILLKNSYVHYVRALRKRDRTGKELAKLTGERSETVSRKLKRLREIGAVDYRRDGTSFYNFLTPAARQIVELGEK